MPAWPASQRKPALAAGAHLDSTAGVRASSGAARQEKEEDDSNAVERGWLAAPEQINHRSGGWGEVTLAIFLPKKRFSNVLTNAYTFASYKVVTWKDGRTPGVRARCTPRRRGLLFALVPSCPAVP